MSVESQFSNSSTSKAFAAFQIYFSTNVRITPKFSLLGRKKKGFTFLRTQRARGPLVSCCLEPGKPNREDLSRKHQDDNGRAETSLSTSEFGFILTSIVTATAGGPALAFWGLFFLILGKYTSAPTWLQVMSTCIFAGITDALGYNWTSVSFDSGYVPFLVFFVGSGATLIYESASSYTSADDSGPLPKSNRSNQELEEGDGAFRNNDVHPNPSSRENELAQWDNAFSEARRDNDGNAK